MGWGGVGQLWQLCLTSTLCQVKLMLGFDNSHTKFPFTSLFVTKSKQELLEWKIGIYNFTKIQTSAGVKDIKDTIIEYLTFIHTRINCLNHSNSNKRSNKSIHFITKSSVLDNSEVHSTFCQLHYFITRYQRAFASFSYFSNRYFL